jgi:folate-binding protein YgfZ
MSLDFFLPLARLKQLRSGAVMVRDDPAVLRVEGPGALTCLQGLLTQDLAAPGEGTLVYGAVLTPKGMIVADAWVLREEAGFILVLESGARTAMLTLLARSLPPRLARTSDLSDSWSAIWMVGGAAPERLARALGRDVPGTGKVLRAGPAGPILAGGTEPAPFRVLCLGPRADLDGTAAAFPAGTACRGDPSDLAAARVLAGWPTLFREIDEKTLPQEVRFEEIGGVSYTKGCYTGQETVARVHFRGHVNRTLRGVVLKGGEPPGERILRTAGKEVGRLATALILEDRVLGLALVRREVENGAVVLAGEREARVVPLPFGDLS